MDTQIFLQFLYYAKLYLEAGRETKFVRRTNFLESILYIFDENES